VNLIHKSCGLETRPQVIPCFPLDKHGKNLQNIWNIVIMKTDGVRKKLQDNDELLSINDQVIYPPGTDNPSGYNLSVKMNMGQNPCHKADLSVSICLQDMLKDKPAKDKFCLPIHLNTKFMPRQIIIIHL